MKDVDVYSPIEDKKIKTNFNDSPIWAKGKAYTEEEYLENPKRYSFWWKYTFKFEGLKVIMHTKTQKLAN